MNPFEPEGSILAHGSKSELNRLLLMAALCEGETHINNLCLSDDISAMTDCLKALGANVRIHGEGAFVTGIRLIDGVPTLYVRESGTALRFLLPVACALYESVRFECAPSLAARPLEGLIECMEEHGVAFSSHTPPFETNGRLQKGVYKPKKLVSSQYISGLLIASVLTGGRVEYPKDIQSRPYIDMTLALIKRFAPEGKYVSPGRVTCEGDWSLAAAILAFGAFSDKGVTVRGLNLNSLQGDRRIVEILRQSGCEVNLIGDSVTVKRGKGAYFEADISDTPDLVGPCAALAVRAGGRISGCERLIYKESNRLEGIKQIITALGGECEIRGGTLIIGAKPLKGGRVPAINDHRMVMTACALACACTDAIYIENAESVNKSCPNFWQILKDIGGETHVV